MSVDIKNFCKNQNKDNWKKLADQDKKLFMDASLYCMVNNKGNIKISQKVLVLDGNSFWEFVKVPKGSIIYRGSKEIPDQSNVETYYALEIGTANRYIRPRGYINVYRTKKELQLFKLNSLHNANRLLRETFYDKKIVKKCKPKGCFPGYTLYDIIVTIYTGLSWIAKNDKIGKPKVLTKIGRHSDKELDYIFSKWLCDNGFNGYRTDIMKGIMFKTFPAEIMLCKPGNDLKLLENIYMKQAKTDSDTLYKIAKKYGVKGHFGHDF